MNGLFSLTSSFGQSNENNSLNSQMPKEEKPYNKPPDNISTDDDNRVYKKTPLQSNEKMEG